MQARFGTFPHSHTQTFSCPKCGSCGVVNWDLVQTPDGPRKDFAGLSGNFYERISNKPPYAIEMVCVSCNASVAGEPIALSL